MMKKAAGCAAVALLAVALCAGCSQGASSGSSKAQVSDVEALQANTSVSDAPRSAASQTNAEDEQLKGQISSIVEQYSGSYAVACQAVDGSWKASVNASDSHVAASMIKLAIMGALFDQESKGLLSLDDTVVLQSSDIVGGSGVIGAQGAGSTWTYRELLEHMIQDSDNTATNVIIDKVGMSNVNSWSSSFGLEATTLNRMMMDLNSGVENYTSAQDVATILQAIWDGTFVNESASKEALAILEGQNETTGMELGLPSGATFAHKTGDLDEVLNDGGIVETRSPYILVVLASDLTDSSASSAMQEIAQTVSVYAE